MNYRLGSVMEKIEFNLKKRSDKVRLPEPLGFGKYFTDHMFEMDYSTSKGWHNPKITPVQNLLR